MPYRICDMFDCEAPIAEEPDLYDIMAGKASCANGHRNDIDRDEYLIRYLEAQAEEIKELKSSINRLEIQISRVGCYDQN